MGSFGGNVAVDSTLTQTGLAADAKATGDAINGLQADVDKTLPLSGGTMTGELNTNGIVLTENVDYGDEVPTSGEKGRLFFVRLQ